MSGGALVPDLDVNALITATEAAVYAGVKVTTVCKWRERGWLPVAKGDDGAELRDRRGSRLYRLLDVAKAEAGTRQRAALMAGRLAARAAA
jgi:hypothetical protein